MRQCPNCGWVPDSPDTDYCASCGEAMPPSPAGPDTTSDRPTHAEPRPQPGPATAGSAPPTTVRNWAMATHLAAFAVFVVPVPVVGPLVVWLLKREEHPYIDEQGKEAVNFNISVLIYTIVSALLMLIAVGVVLLAVVGIAWFVLTIIAAVRTANGEEYRYPATMRFVR